MENRIFAVAFACLAITAAPCSAGGNGVSGCLETRDPAACLIEAASSCLAKGTDGESLSEGYEALLMALARTGILCFIIPGYLIVVARKYGFYGRTVGLWFCGVAGMGLGTILLS